MAEKGVFALKSRFSVTLLLFIHTGTNFGKHDKPVLSCAARGNPGIGLRLVFFQADDERGRRLGDNEGNSPLRTERGDGLSETAVQGSDDSFRHPGCFFRDSRIRFRSPEYVGAFRIPDRRFLFRTCRIRGYEDCHICFCKDCECSHAFP